MVSPSKICVALVLAAAAAACGPSADPEPRYTWTDGASSFFGTHCAGCHDASHSGGDYSRYDDVRDDAEPMRCGLAAVQLDGCAPPMPGPATFPTGPRPPEEEIDEVLNWLETGLPR